MLWEVDIYAAEGQPDLAARDVVAAVAELHLAGNLAVISARGYLIQGDLDRRQVTRIADELLADRVVERTVVAPTGDPVLCQLPEGEKGDITDVCEAPGGPFRKMSDVPFFPLGFTCCPSPA